MYLVCIGACNLCCGAHTKCSCGTRKNLEHGKDTHGDWSTFLRVHLSATRGFPAVHVCVPAAFVERLALLWSSRPCCCPCLGCAQHNTCCEYRSALCMFRKPVLVMSRAVSRAVQDDSFVRRGSGPQCPKMCWLHHDGMRRFGTQHVLLLEASMGECCLLLRLLWRHHVVHHLWNVRLCLGTCFMPKHHVVCQ